MGRIKTKQIKSGTNEECNEWKIVPKKNGTNEKPNEWRMERNK